MQTELPDPEASASTPTPKRPTQQKIPASAESAEGDGEEDDEEQVDLAHIQSFADKVQHVPGFSRPQINIPKRGEKDFEPLEETVKLQEMMLQRSREALFGALQGVRGGNSKSMSHALLTPASPYPHLLIARGHVLDSMGISMRSDRKGKAKARTQLLPEEALFLLERGSLQVWVGSEEDVDEEEAALGSIRRRLGHWDEEECGVVGAVELSVSEGFAAFLGKDGLTWERYQAYAYLKRLGYTVQRTRRNLPSYFSQGVGDTPKLPPFRTWWYRIPQILGHLWATFARKINRFYQNIRFSQATLLSSWRGVDYASLFRHLRIMPASHTQPLPLRPTAENPYIPFFHVWKPAVPWSKAKWDRGSDIGIERQPPDFQISAINARTEPLPTIHQLHEIFEELPDERKGPPQRHGPQYRQISTTPRSNPIAELRNGDRALIVAVNDSGNTGWVRFGRTGFAGLAMI